MNRTNVTNFGKFYEKHVDLLKFLYYHSLLKTNYKEKEYLSSCLLWIEKSSLCKETIRLNGFYKKYGFKFCKSNFKIQWDYDSIELSLLTTLMKSRAVKQQKMIKKYMGWIEKFKERLKTKFIMQSLKICTNY